MKTFDAVVTGAGGFIGGHLVRSLLDQDAVVRAVDVKPLNSWQQNFAGVENRVCDLSDLDACQAITADANTVYHLAADMGGMGFIENNRALCMLSVLPNTNMLLAARDNEVDRFFFSSSACVYAANKQATTDPIPLAESDAYPAEPEDGYGWEKLFTERMCRHFFEDFGLETRVARYHNIYGPYGTWTGGREKAPAAICRKVATALLTGSGQIEIWGDGQQARSFTFVDDCIHGTKIVTAGTYPDPVNIGSDQLVTIDALVSMVEAIAGVQLHRRYAYDAPKGVRGRNSDNSLISERYGWAPCTRLEEGLKVTFSWIYDRVAEEEGA